MNPVTIILILIGGLFVTLLGLKRVTGWRFCVICASVSFTWLLLLALYFSGGFPHPILLAVLMGESVVGGYYLWSAKVGKHWLIFRLPLLLSATVAVFAMLGYWRQMGVPLIILAVVWILFGGAFVYRRNPKINALAQQVIACCRNW